VDSRRWIGVDVGSENSSICIIDNASKVVRQDDVPTSAAAVGAFIAADRGDEVILVGVEASSLSPPLVRGLRSQGLPVAMFDSRQARKFLRLRQNKTDRNDARGLAEIALHGRNTVSEVRLKSVDCQKVRSQLAIRQHLVRHRVASEAAIRAILRLNGGKLKKSTSANMLRRNTVDELRKLQETEGLDLTETIEPVPNCVRNCGTMS
jgi:transposase